MGVPGALILATLAYTCFLTSQLNGLLCRSAFVVQALAVPTNLRTITQAMDKNKIYKNVGEIDDVIKDYFTIPITSATAELAFSSLQKLKTFVRSKMTH